MRILHKLITERPGGHSRFIEGAFPRVSINVKGTQTMKIIVVRSKGAMRYILSKIFGIETKKNKK